MLDLDRDAPTAGGPNHHISPAISGQGGDEVFDLGTKPPAAKFSKHGQLGGHVNCRLPGSVAAGSLCLMREVRRLDCAPLQGNCAVTSWTVVFEATGGTLRLYSRAVERCDKHGHLQTNRQKKARRSEAGRAMGGCAVFGSWTY
jgi:hypothetical protein